MNIVTMSACYRYVVCKVYVLMSVRTDSVSGSSQNDNLTANVVAISDQSSVSIGTLISIIGLVAERVKCQ